ncbi:hypothetical protein GE061_004052 [Apolygus lucorum]|uniref:Uncharacterized protein n=1 Tax=Apolygus lucorum TaxID=248454 RepID=A0A8S9WZL1_APOLU|nr:hypothetical protein GE061_004052 [Apolygus lucorum]
MYQGLSSVGVLLQPGRREDTVLRCLSFDDGTDTALPSTSRVVAATFAPQNEVGTSNIPRVTSEEDLPRHRNGTGTSLTLEEPRYWDMCHDDDVPPGVSTPPYGHPDAEEQDVPPGVSTPPYGHPETEERDVSTLRYGPPRTEEWDVSTLQYGPPGTEERDVSTLRYGPPRTEERDVSTLQYGPPGTEERDVSTHQYGSPGTKEWDESEQEAGCHDYVPVTNNKQPLPTSSYLCYNEHEESEQEAGCHDYVRVTNNSQPLPTSSYACYNEHEVNVKEEKHAESQADLQNEELQNLREANKLIGLPPELNARHHAVFIRLSRFPNFFLPLPSSYFPTFPVPPPLPRYINTPGEAWRAFKVNLCADK